MKKRILSGLLALTLMSGGALAAGEKITAVRVKGTVNGAAVEFPAVSVENQWGWSSNYVKVRDLAMLVKGTGGEFSVDFDGSTLLWPKGEYSPVGTEMEDLTGKDMAMATSIVTVNGDARTLEAVWVKSGENDGYLCYKLRDLGAALGLDIGWNAAEGVTIVTPAKVDAAVAATENLSEYDREIQKIMEQDKEKYGY